jgi:hypothetical protein
MKQIKRTLAVLTVVMIASFAEPTFNFNLTEREALLVINAIQSSDIVSSKDANSIIGKMQRQAGDSTLNPRPKDTSNHAEDTSSKIKDTTKPKK